MNDMSQVIIPKSDQVSADDFISGPRTYVIEAIEIRPGTEQPVSIFLAGEDRVWKPCKSMSRVLVSAWGPDAKVYVGRAVTLYRDPKVKWGGLEVGGIRVSHLSDISNEMVMALTATKGKRAPFIVKPIAAPPRRQPAGYDNATESCLATLKNIARGGMTALEDGWKAITPEMRKILRDELPALKTIADDFSSPPSPAGTPTAEAGSSNTDGDAGAVQEGLPDEERGDGDADREARSAITDYIQAVKDAPDDAALAEVYTRGNELAATIRADFPDLYAEIDPFRPADAPERGEGGR